MPIIVTCTGCGRKLRLADEHAGKTARCPACRMTFQVPLDAAKAPDGGSDDVLRIDENTPTPKLAPMTTPTSAPLGSSAPADAWYLRVPEGHQYGPVPKTEMDNWVREGRVTAQCQLKNGDGPWQPAASIYSQLGGAQSGVGPFQPVQQPANPFAQPMGGAPYNPYASPMAPQMGYPPNFAYRKPHRGGMILALGILSFFCCPIMIINLVLASNDLSEMERGTMDTSGQGLTRTGQILSFVALGLTLLGIVLQVVLAVAVG